MAEGEVVERLVVEFDAKIDKVLAKLNGLNRAVHGSAHQIEMDFKNIHIDEALYKVFSAGHNQVIEEAAGKLGIFGKALEPLGALGLGAAAGIGAVGLAIEEAVKAAEWAEQLEMTAKKIGVTTTALQEFDFVATASGIPIEAMRESLGGLQAKIGQVQSGVAKAQTVKIFEALDITPDQLRRMGDLQTILPVIAEKLSELPSAERAGLAARLDITPILPALLKGKDGLSDLTAEAHRYGIVVDADVVAKSAEAAEKLKIASDIIDKNLKVAFANLATPIAAATLELAKFLAAAAKIGQIKSPNDYLSVIAKRQWLAGDTDGANKTEAAWRKNMGLGVTTEDILNRLGMHPEVAALVKSTSRTGRAGRATRATAVDTGPDTEAMARDGQAAITRAMEQELRAREQLADTADERLALGKSLIDVETAAQIKANDDLVAKGKISEVDALLANLDIQMAGDEKKLLLQREADLKVKAAQDAAKQAQDDATAEQAKTIHDAYYNAIHGALDAAVRGGWPGLAKYMADTLQRHLLDALSNSLTNVLLGGGAGGGTGLFGAVLGAAFGLPGFASGTDSAPGGLSLVGEHGPELMNVPKGAQIVPNGLLGKLGGAASAGGGGGVQVLSFDLRGAVMTQDLLAQMNRMADHAAQSATIRGAALGAAAARSIVPNEIGLRQSRILR